MFMIFLRRSWFAILKLVMSTGFKISLYSQVYPYHCKREQRIQDGLESNNIPSINPAILELVYSTCIFILIFSSSQIFSLRYRFCMYSKDSVKIVGIYLTGSRLSLNTNIVKPNTPFPSPSPLLPHTLPPPFSALFRCSNLPFPPDPFING